MLVYDTGFYDYNDTKLYDINDTINGTNLHDTNLLSKSELTKEWMWFTFCMILNYSTPKLLCKSIDWFLYDNNSGV